MAELAIAGRVWDFLNPKFLGVPVASGDETHFASWDGQASRLHLSLLGFERLVVRIISSDGKLLWCCLSPTFRRTGPGPLMFFAEWNHENFLVATNSRVFGSRTSTASFDPIEVGGWDIENQTFQFEKRSARARNRRRINAGSLSAAESKRLVTLFVAEIQNLKLNLRDHRSGFGSRVVSVMGLLRKLVSHGTEGDFLLQKVAGIVDGPLDVYTTSLEGLFGPGISQMVSNGHFGDSLFSFSKVATRPTPSMKTRLDLDVWLTLQSWIFQRKLISNEVVITKSGDKTGVHADAEETPLMEEARHIWVPHHLGGDLLNLWTLAVAETVIALAQDNIFQRIPSELGLKNAIETCLNIRMD